ncbi:MAG: hypothetical protein K2K23_02315 [Muribaculaceae bacterium]|nr:hypothetical protein [Muribaculaceae bacterium]
MKQKRLLFTAIGLIAVVLANATTWRINPNPTAKAQYKTVAEAMDDVYVQPGDTLLLDAGSHGDVNISKENITVIGTGYLLDQNKNWSENDQTFISTAILNAQHGTIEGCSANGISTSGHCTVRRCKANSISASDYSVVEQSLTNSISVNSFCNVKNNIILGTVFSPWYSSEGIVIENNTIITSAPYESGATPLNINPGNNCIVRNNIILNTCTDLNNNLVPASSSWVYPSELPGVSMYNNITSIAPEHKDSKYNNHDIGATVESVFVNAGSDDGKWKLSANSPAKGAASDEGDCGAFGGRTPYVLSGIPQFIPHITKIEVPTRPTDGKITIKLKIENQDE